MEGYGKRPLWQWILIYLVVGGLIYGAVYYFYFAKKGGYTNTGTGSNYNYAATPTATQAMVKSVTITLNAENNSSESGTATLSEEGGKTTVALSLTGYPANAQPAHIHVGACPGVGAVKYPLTNAVNGQSTTVLNVTLDTLKSELPLALNVHKSASSIGVYTSCGALSFQ